MKYFLRNYSENTGINPCSPSSTPEYQEVDRTGKIQLRGSGVAYPETRQYWVDEVQQIIDNYDVDGVYLTLA